MLLPPCDIFPRIIAQVCINFQSAKTATIRPEGQRYTAKQPPHRNDWQVMGYCKGSGKHKTLETAGNPDSYSNINKALSALAKNRPHGLAQR